MQEKNQKIKINYNILIVEDNLGDLVLIQEYLLEKFQNISISSLSDFKSVLECFQTTEPIFDLILLDLKLPDLKGIELIANMIKSCEKTPIIVLTGYVDLILAKESLSLGIYDFLIKDEINPEILCKSIEFAISRSTYINHIELQTNKLRNIAWTQSHLVRAPLTRMMGIIDVLENEANSEKEIKFWVSQLRSSTEELDTVIRNIVNETKSIF